MNRIRIVLICLAATFLMSGFVNPIGLVSGPVASAFDLSVAEAVSAFGYFTIGVFAGYVVSFYIFDYLAFKLVVVISYILLVAAIACLYLVDSIGVLSALLFVIGTLASIEVCAAGTLITTNWQQKPRQVMLIGQDAMFNGGGILFTSLATQLVVSEAHWATTYMAVGVFALVLVAIAAMTDIERGSAESQTPLAPEISTEWNAGVLLVGFSLALFMTAKISIFIWVPQFVIEQFDADVAESGRLLTNIFIGAFAGSLIGTWLVAKMPIGRFLVMMLFVGTTGMWLLLSADELAWAMLTGYLVGASVGATFNGYTAFGLSFVTLPTHKHISYILTAGGIGSAIAPWISSACVDWLGSVGDTLFACFLLQVLVLANVLLLGIYHQKLTKLSEVHR